MTSSSIVCGVDGSRDARVALRLAQQLSGRLGVRLVVAHVVHPPLPAPGLGATARQLAGMPVDALLAAGEALVERILEEEQLGEAERRVELGYPADRLADVADDEAAQLIVVGSRGRGAFRSAFLGSVSNEVVGVARCPVLVVPPAAAVASSARAEEWGAEPIGADVVLRHARQEADRRSETDGRGRSSAVRNSA